MTRKEEIERKAKIRADQYSHPVEWNDCYHHWIEGAEWADEHPRNDVIGVDSITYVRNILVGKFCDIAKKNPDKIYDEVPEMKEAFEMADMFDKACEFAGYKFNEEKGIYEIL